MKKTAKKLFTALLMMSWLPGVAGAQSDCWVIYGGYNHAVGNFARVDLDNNDWAFTSNTSNKGGSGMGFDLGVAYRMPISKSGRLNLVFSAELFYNNPSFRVKYKSAMAMLEASSNFRKVSITNPNFINVPILGGLHYEFPISERFNLYLEAQAGVAICKVTKRGAEFIGGNEPIEVGNQDLYDYIYTDRFYTSPSLALHCAVGLVGQKRFMMDLGLWHMGELTLEGYENYEYRTSPTTDTRYSGGMAFTLGRISPLILALRVGYRL